LLEKQKNRTLYVSLKTRDYRPKPILERKEQKTLVSKEMTKTHGLRYHRPEIARKKEKQKKEKQKKEKQKKGKQKKGKRKNRTVYVSLKTRDYRPKPILERKEQKTLVSKEMAKTHGLRYQIPEIARKRKNRKTEKGKTERYTLA